MTTLDLVPGLITTREKIAEAYGGSKYSGGIVPAKQSKMVFVFSDPKVGEKFGYTFDGQAEDDEFGTLYLYTGAGGEGHQEFVRGNKTLLETATNGQEVHLFVAHSRVPGKKEVRQRYVGRVALDRTKPYEVRWSPVDGGTPRRIIVFRLRPAEGSELLLLEQDALKPAARTSVIELSLEQTLGNLPAQSGVKDKKTEQHSTTETTANITGGPRPVFRREGQLVKAFESHLEEAGHSFKSFQITIKGEPGALTPDVYDETDHVLYEAKGQTTRNNVRMAIGQLADYRRHMDNVEKLRVAVLLPSEPTPDVRDLLAAQRIALVYQTEDGFEGFPIPTTP
ncbi:hypothetical protein [Streptomyces sp. SPB4]|uniref:hypothetical protein n=1 Tax=Streptomyces sp. SPB4 TaxID=2940553 RepID=UPI0024760963|nr:hypothetical protein [Streptomyces sp. SPB4]MDH6543309.1 hypothetical protein [Streptomyces sp. SPB4]